jgi:hypothetical protein
MIWLIRKWSLHIGVLFDRTGALPWAAKAGVDSIFAKEFC